jgi:hypothetical protein
VLTVSLVVIVIVYRWLVILLGAIVAGVGVWCFRSSRAKTGEITGEYKNAKVSFKNPSLGAFFCFIGIVAIIAGFLKSPAITVEERGKDGEKVRIIKIEGLPPVRHIEPEDTSIADLLTNPKKYRDGMVRVRGKVTEWMMRGGQERYMLFTLEDGNSKLKVFSLRVKYFETGKEDVVVTGKFLVGDEGKGLDASPDVGGIIQRTKAKGKDDPKE